MKSNTKLSFLTTNTRSLSFLVTKAKKANLKGTVVKVLSVSEDRENTTISTTTYYLSCYLQ